MVIKYQRVKKSQLRKALGEKNDCAVVAIALVCRTTYPKAHALLTHYGRRTGGSTETQAILAAVKDSGFRVERVEKYLQPNGSRYTPKTIGGYLKRGYYLCFTAGHVFTVINGVVEDWSGDSHRRIKSIYKVVRPRRPL